MFFQEDDYKLEQELTSFRQKWHEEIQGKQDDTTDVASSNHGENESKNSASNGLPNISTSSSVNEREVPDATVKEETEKEQKVCGNFFNPDSHQSTKTSFTEHCSTSNPICISCPISLICLF